MYESISTFFSEHKKIIITIIGCCILLLVSFLFGVRWGIEHTKPADNDNISKTVQGISDDNTRAGQAVERATSEVENAKADTERASQIGQRITDTVGESTNRLDECDKIVEQLKRNNSTAKSILTEFKPADKSTAEKK